MFQNGKKEYIFTFIYPFRLVQLWLIYWIYIIGCPARYNQITVEMSVKGFKFSAYTAFEKGGGCYVSHLTDTRTIGVIFFFCFVLFCFAVWRTDTISVPQFLPRQEKDNEGFLTSWNNIKGIAMHWYSNTLQDINLSNWLVYLQRLKTCPKYNKDQRSAAVIILRYTKLRHNRLWEVTHNSPFGTM